MAVRFSGAAIGVAALAMASPGQARDTRCSAGQPLAAQATPAASVLEPAGLLALRDIGHPDGGLGGASPLAISPDGRHVAFFVSQANLKANDICETLVLVDLMESAAPRVLDSGGSGIRLEEVLRGLRRPSGVFDVNRPVWSPDGRSLAYRKRVSGSTQVWRAFLDGTAPRQLSQAADDVEAVAWGTDGDQLLFSVRPGRAALAAARLQEARTGYHYDARFLPHLEAAPQLPADMVEEVQALDLRGLRVRLANKAEQAAFARPVPLGAFDLGPVKDMGGRNAGADPIDKSYFAARRLWADTGNGRRVDCSHPACTGAVRTVWWQGGEIMFLARSGWHREASVIAAWSPGTSRVRTVITTLRWLSGCVSARARILCLAESARQPRQIVAIDPKNGREHMVFDPNPDLDETRLPAVRRLRWRNGLGLAAWADLVVPTGTPPAGGWPLVVVQYHSEGFLRGGTGDEYPIYPLAARGIAVFSFQRPALVATLDPKISDVASLSAATYRGWADRRSVHDSLMRGVDLALAQAPINRARIGITGLSDGSTTARFALIQDDRFAAAAISTCCLEPNTTMTLGGVAQADWFRSIGYPDASRSDPAFWLPISMAMNAQRMHTPLLMQLSDDEYIHALETFTALREHGKPVEMYVFPDEHHNKWQPVHRAAVYARNLDWFSFWLQDRVDHDPAKKRQYERWSAMRIAAARR